VDFFKAKGQRGKELRKKGCIYNANAACPITEDLDDRENVVL
jgi:hypothetical protein